MTERAVAVLARSGVRNGAPPGIEPEAWQLALLEDTYEVCAALDLVQPAVVLSGNLPDEDVLALTWPGTLTLRSPDTLTALRLLSERGFTAAAVVAADVPDLPGLLIGKLFRALGTAEVAGCPAEGGGLVAVAARLPVAGWLAGAGPDLLDEPDAFEALRRRAPHRRAVAVGPGWHRLRTAADVARLDPGLEGWDATRSLLSRVHGRS